MIVRMNQLDLQRVEALSGWTDGMYSGAVHYIWPEDTAALEIFIRELDEHAQPMAVEARRMQLRRLIAYTAFSLVDEDYQLVLRLDGPCQAGELWEAFEHLPLEGDTRFAVSPLRRLSGASGHVEASIRLAPTLEWMLDLCSDARIGMDRNVRLRAFSTPLPLVDPLLDIDDLDDERWSDILPIVGSVVQTSRRLSAIQILTRRFDAQQAKARLSEGLRRAWENERQGTSA